METDVLDIRPFDSLGHARFGWLDARHHFSFGNYYDPGRMGWGALRVWNDDTIAPDSGFERHGHRDMEIITYVRKGAITHRDHLGNEGRTEAGDVQVMSAGKGILHEEHNLEPDETQIFQIWIEPAAPGGEPFWRATRFPRGERAGRLVTLASGRDGRPEDALLIRQDAALLAASLAPGQQVEFSLATGRLAYLVPAAGEVAVNGQPVAARDGVALSGAVELVIANDAAASGNAEIILADVPR